MKIQRAMGPDAGVVKYDLLTALSVAGLAGSPGLATSLMRLIALVTARYNWREDEFCVGQKDMARMWSVDERTVKRQIKRLLEAEVLICKRPGVRGRVGAYRLNHGGIARLSAPTWHLVGPDFEARMQARYGADEAEKVVRLGDYVAAAEPAKDTGASGTPWARAMATLRSEDKAQYEAWFQRLGYLSVEGGVVHVTCPSAFIRRYIETHLMQRLLNAVRAEFGGVSEVRIRV
ncbi:hypothetical protein BOO69_18975 (plasmid) [Sulfitobacter alexandrii]|uniref:DnaA N-terminal domain-containing protein n=1 Tax=Sulfitobacter alexandrii TaxID=1917485 RepID=A0A1J0WNK4_9RHOB|nr:DnaA N-terminal domain-containing protein [Sulfitobacter alexandrii]APE45744.1 hypothetical protein BOO69_18975 [Sulfitobacter alexandrii]